MPDDTPRMGRTLEDARNDVARFQSQLQRSATREEALESAIKAAEASMAALKLSQDFKLKAQFSSQVKSLLGQAEMIKHDPGWRPDSARPREPRSTRQLPTSEQILLLKSGYLNGCKFPFWTAEPVPAEFDLKPGESPYVDSCELPLSDFQEEVFDDWKRPNEALPPPTWFPGDRGNLEPVMHVDGKIDLVQDAATDCSVVASLCAAVARAESGHSRMLPHVLYPNLGEHPAISPNGKYIVRLNFNGCFRKVVIDDTLPVSNTTRVIHVVDRQNPNLLWPPLLEKAYLKVRGGYDFPGSNSGTDLWILTGWIPEQVFLQSNELGPQQLWDDIFPAFNQGNLLITTGTGKMSDQFEKDLGLVGEHDYAVLDLREVDGQRLLLVKNPWCEGTSWRGRFNAGQQDSEHVESSETTRIDFNEDNEPLRSSRDLLNANDELSPGTFWIDLDNVIQLFESIYLNWNSRIFSHRQDIHFSWDLSDSLDKPRGSHASLVHNPQFTVKADSHGIVWILLWRHFRNVISAAATDEEIESGTYRLDLNGHMTLIAFDADGKRVLLPERHLEKGWFVDSPQTLMRLENCAPGKAYTIAPLEQNLDPGQHTFTISTFSHSPLTLVTAPPRYPCANVVAGSWTKETAGGNAHSPRYCSNPQFSIQVTHKTAISILLETKDDSLPVHVKLVYGKGQRMHAIRGKDIIFDSKDYRRGCCVAQHSELDAGGYTIICSTFEPQQLANFSLRIESTQPTQTTLLPRDGAGRIRLDLEDVKFQKGQNTMAAPVAFQRLVKFYGIARYLDYESPGNASKRSLIRMSVEGGSRAPLNTHVASNGGEYSDSFSGIRTSEVDLGPSHMKQSGQMWLILDRMPGSSETCEESFSIELYVDQPDALLCGEWREWEA